MLQLITNNPFRILGVYANSPLRDIVANKNKMNAFLKVGKTVSFPLDITQYLGDVYRTTETVAAADTKLTIEADKLSAAQFWFIKNTSFDSIAFNHINSGNIDNAINIWEKQDNMSSLQNRAVCYIILDDFKQATKCLSILYEKHNQEFASVIGINHDINMKSLVQNFIMRLMEEIPDIDFKILIGEHCSDSWNTTTTEGIVRPIIKTLTDAIAKSKQTKGKDIEKRFESGKQLLKESKQLLFKLRQLLPSNDLQLVSISDKVCNEVIQCSIDYYNASDSPYVAKDAYELMKSASMLAMGAIIKNRCEENINTIQDVLSTLPPNEVKQEVLQIRAALSEFNEAPELLSHSITLLDITYEPLESMKSKLGPTHQAYLKESSIIANNALHNVIAEINNTFYNEESSIDINDMSYYIDRALDIVQRLQSMDLDEETWNRVDTNYNTLIQFQKRIDNSNSNNDSMFTSCIIQILVYAIIAVLIYTCTR